MVCVVQTIRLYDTIKLCLHVYSMHGYIALEHRDRWPDLVGSLRILQTVALCEVALACITFDDCSSIGISTVPLDILEWIREIEGHYPSQHVPLDSDWSRHGVCTSVVVYRKSRQHTLCREVCAACTYVWVWYVDCVGSGRVPLTLNSP